MRFTDVDWREVLNSWDEADIEYLRSICDEKLEQIRWKRRLFRIACCYETSHI